MTDIFDAENITAFKSGFASTAPSTTPTPVPIPPVSVSKLTERVSNTAGPVPAPPDPQQIAARMGDASNAASAVPVVAPPQAPANPDDILSKEGIDTVSAAGNPFGNRVVVPNTPAPDAHPAAQYAQQQMQQAQALGQKRFTPEQLAAFARNPQSWSEAINNQQDWPDVPTLLQKQAAGQQLDDAQNGRLNEYVDTVLSSNLRGTAWDGDKALTGSQLPAQAINHINTGDSGLISAGTEPQTPPAVTGKQVIPAPYAPQYGETALNDHMAVTDKGLQVIKGQQDKPASAALMASAGISLDAAQNPEKVASPLITSVDQLPPGIKAALFDAYKETNPKAKMSDVMTQQGWSNAIATVGEDKVKKIVGAFMEGFKEPFQTPPGLAPEDYTKIGLATDPDNAIDFIKQLPAATLNGGLALADTLAIRFPSAVFGGGIAAIRQTAIEAGMSETNGNMLERDLNGIAANEMARSGGHAPEAKSGLEAPQAQPTIDEMINAVTPQSPEKTMVNNGIMSIDGSQSHATAGVVTAFEKAGHTNDQARELASNMSANEKDNFIAQNFPKPKGTFPRVAPAPEVVDSMVRDMSADTTMSQPQTVFYDGEITRKQLDSAEAKSPPPLNDDESVFDLYYRAMHHDLAPAEIPFKNAVKAGAKVDRLDNTPMMIALNHQIPSMVDYYVNEGTFSFDANGRPIDTGKSLKATFDDFDNYFKGKEPSLEARRADFNDFLIARHYQAILEHAKDVKVTDEQVSKSAADLSRLADKYGDDIRFFHTFGNEFVSFRKRTRDLLVGTLLTKEQRAIEDKRYPYSIPLKREIDNKQYYDDTKRGDYTALNPTELTKRLKGSHLPVKDIVQQTLRETARTIDFVQRNRVANSIYNLRDFAPDRVQVTTRPSVLKGSATFDHAYDPKLRSKLEQVASSLGINIKRTETIEGENGTLGMYDMTTKDIYLKHGTTEGTLTHELGHGLDLKYGLEQKWLGDKDIKSELEKLSENRLKSEIELQTTDTGKTKFVEDFDYNPEKYVNYVKSPKETLANFFDAWVNSPKQVAEIAPKAKLAFEKLIKENPELDALNDIAPSTARKVEKIKKDVYGRGDLPKNSFPFWKDGKEVLLQVSKPMYEALSKMRPSQLNMAERFFMKSLRVLSGAKPLRTGATSTPEFAARNVVKDTLEASVQSGVKYNPSYIPKSLFGVLFKDAGYRDFIQSGGKFGHFMSLGEDDIEHTFQDILNPQSKFSKLLHNPSEAFEAVPKVSEQITRYGVYKAAIDAGFSPVEASHYSLDATLQFPRGGFISRKINQFIPFFNVGLLATEKLVRAFRDDPKTMLLRGTTYLTVPALGIAGYYLYGADDETRKAWLEIPIDRISAGQIPFAYNKETGNWRYLPTPYALGYMFAGLPMLMLRQMQADAPDDGKAIWSHVMTGFMGSISPINDASAVLPPTVKVMIEDATNYDLYRGREIYSKYKEGEGVLQQDKTNPYDSETAKQLGNLTGTSPALIDHSLYGMFGSSAGYGLAASDALINGYRTQINGETLPEKPTNTAGGIFKPFTIRSPDGFRSNSYQQFQSNLLNATALAAHLKSLEGTDGYDKFQAANEKQLDALQDLKAVSKDIQKETKRISGIYNDADMKAAEKATEIREIEKGITERAREANINYNAATKGGK